MQTVLITGISRGIGRALAGKFLSEGWTVIGTSLAGEGPQSHDLLSVFPLDLTSPQSITDCTAAIAATGKKVDVLINNAGALFDEEDIVLFAEKLRKTMEVNVIGTADFTEHMLPFVNHGGHIINISSTAGSLERAGTVQSHEPFHYPAYKISKAALNMYTRTLAPRTKKDDIVVSSAHPGWVKTDMGGQEADITPQEAAESIYALALSHPETGQFWFNGEKLPW